ncbi:3-phosphoshikimate 1-carboxyvinyltransferase [Parvicella tangerina]|uniref:3-phosphoshikimate 1-carboxyvinyltransferase n=1 Tax=Parvicella tangerina TaxID=2829795 RepID=A0A916N9Y3_9FLAO|nr:3-phosphoshikimate 1-carboxyvinyltransferase [Parvicella tangerina]CAG5079839.1 3-phosphoshikimate 1-carboxyvinyltransferase [Parvicella tangerina]
MIHLSDKNSKIDAVIELTRSKSESNRALILKTLLKDSIHINNLSDSDDTKALMEALNEYQDSDEINVGHAGTTFRFLTAFLAIQPAGSWILTGSERMKERPIKVMVDALRIMGAKIEYLGKDGFPPLKIQGTSFISNEVSIDAGVSSQYISALMMVGTNIQGGLKIRLDGKITSLPYLMMTFSMMEELGVGVSIDLEEQLITIEEKRKVANQVVNIEGDWSAASYWYSLVALGEIGSQIKLLGLNQTSRQGDARIKSYFEQLGVESSFDVGTWTLTKISEPELKLLQLDLSDTPDVAQTLVCACAGLGVGVDFTGLHTLRIKETDRLMALQNELEKFNIRIEVPSNHQLFMKAEQVLSEPKEAIATYKDHRMAMAFAPLAMKAKVAIEHEEVVSKSYPSFWNDLKKVLNVGS